MPEESQTAAPPAMPGWKIAAYMMTSALLALTQSFGQFSVLANITQLQGDFGATQVETMWLIAAYMAPNVSLGAGLIKIRAQYGLRNFAELSILGFLVAALLNFAADDLMSNLAVRFLSGVAAAPITSLAFLYMIEGLPPEKKLQVGTPVVMTLVFAGSSITRLISPDLLEIGSWETLTVLETAMAMIALGLIYLMPLTPPERTKVIEHTDYISFPLIAVGLGALAVVFTLGAAYWWVEQAWIGWVLVLAIASLAIAAMIELNRQNPLLDIRWLCSPPMLHFAGAILLFRLLLSEQGGGASRLLRVLGYQNDETRVLWAIILFGTLLGGLACLLWMKLGREAYFHAVALVLLIVGAWIDAGVTSDLTPQQMYLSQFLIALSAGLFMPPAMIRGFISAMSRGQQYFLGFIIVFLTTQKLGSLAGLALFSSGVTWRTADHLQDIQATLQATDPLVGDRISALAGQLAPVLGDGSLATAQATAQLAQTAQTEAAVMAYADAFMVTAIASSVTLGLLLLHMLFDAWRARRMSAAQDAAPQPAA